MNITTSGYQQEPLQSHLFNGFEAIQDGGVAVFKFAFAFVGI